MFDKLICTVFVCGMLLVFVDDGWMQLKKIDGRLSQITLERFSLMRLLSSREHLFGFSFSVSLLLFNFFEYCNRGDTAPDC